MSLFSPKIKEKIPVISDSSSRYNASPTLVNDLRLFESKGTLTSDCVSYRDKEGEITVEPKDKNWDLYKRVYEQVGIVKNCIDNTTDFAIQSGYELDGKESDVSKIEKFILDTNFDSVMMDIFKQIQIYGNSFLEIAKEGMGYSLKLLPPDQMRVVVFKGNGKDGEIKGYKQLLKDKSIDFTKDEIVHFKWNTATSPFYGISDIKSVLGVLTKMLNYQEDIGEILHGYSNPIIHWKLGTEDSPVTTTDLNSFKSLLNDRKVREDIITSSNVEPKMLISDLRMVQPDGMFRLLENQVIGGLRVPDFFIRGGETSNKATSETSMQAFDRKVKALRTISYVIEDYVFKKVTSGEVRISWNELSVESEHTKAETLTWLVQSGVPLKVALKMCGWGPWVREIKEFPPSPLTTNPPTNPKPKPKESDFDTQADYVDALKEWNRINRRL